MTDKQFLMWIFERLLSYGEHPKVDYMHRLRAIADSLPETRGGSGNRDILLTLKDKLLKTKNYESEHMTAYGHGLTFAIQLLEDKEPQVEPQPQEDTELARIRKTLETLITWSVRDLGEAGVKQLLDMLLQDIEKVTKERERLRDDWKKLRLALNQIAHPTSYGTIGEDPVEIAREALRIGGYL